MKVLLVDDDPDIRRIGSISLEKVGGFEVLLAEGGAAALSILEEHTPDIVLLDMMMPGMDGMATLAQIRASERWRELPVVFMTAKVQGGEIDRYLRSGAVFVIQKPFDPLRLPAEVKRILEQTPRAKG